MNLIAIAVATVASFLLGGLWYSPILFGKIWQKEIGLSDEKIKSHSITPFIVSFFYALFAAVGFNYLVLSSVTLLDYIIVGTIVGVLLVATSMGTNYQFAGKSNKLFLIDAGYHVAQFIIYALVFWFI